MLIGDCQRLVSGVHTFLLVIFRYPVQLLSKSTMSKSNGVSLAFPAEAATKEYAASLDSSDSLAAFREKFIVPSKANIASKKLAKPG